MERILVLNGPNLNLLGERDPGHYGTMTLAEVCDELRLSAEALGVEVECFQSNHEGELIDIIHRERKTSAGLIINPGALTHYSYAIRDAIEAVGLPAVEVHLSDIDSREPWRRNSVIRDVVVLTVSGKGPSGYLEALDELVRYIRSH
ncbi:MAG: type II 3-dehydroquinate dehydratase [Actinobacteria bacterium]|nr:type II 3-dehydroquinate dehydratase [Actinomycetota bacterium]MBU1942248.1 type II 3-dehydroquinate dehydratase [Actinomycetota bacterium]MBU2687403.1 type II 3-dehydroquinate dehydratase [Actinomycetota bacterium]